MSSQNSHVNQWVSEVAQELKPARVQWIDGSDAEHRAICEQLVQDGTFVPLNENEFPASFWCRSDPNDVARVEERTFICSRTPEECGPTNNWCDPAEMRRKLASLMRGCMIDRTMYVVPYLMGPDGSPYSKVGFELTDSPYVVANMRIMARVGKTALKNLRSDDRGFVRGVHSIGTLNAEERYITHFPEDNAIISFNSNYGGNALQGKKCFALRIASTIARREGWLAEHMLILGITNPQGEQRYVCAAFPSACGKTNLAMLVPPESYAKAGWKVTTVGDDIAWLNFGPDGRLYAINPEYGFFGVAPGTSLKTNPTAMNTIRKGHTIFTNTALDLDAMTPWWEGLSDPPKRIRDWLGQEWSAAAGRKAAHANSRFTTPASQCPSIDPNWQSPHGVPISAIIFGGRRARSAPLVYQSFSWQHGTFVGVTVASETTAAAAGAVGQLRRDPMAMLPFIGYHAGDYFRHWLEMGARGGSKMPAIFHVNWFRKKDDKYLWPGFGENLRVLEWMLQRVKGRVDGVRTPLGIQPGNGELNLAGLPDAEKNIDELLAVRGEEWKEDIASQRQFFEKIGPKLPKELWLEHTALKERLGI
jgi:phosphoenolpyruvate carboxykinase (GTP)